MTEAEIAEMLRIADNFECHAASRGIDEIERAGELLREAAKALQVERERCAQLCEDEAERWRGEQDISDFKLCAARIRAGV